MCGVQPGISPTYIQRYHTNPCVNMEIPESTSPPIEPAKPCETSRKQDPPKSHPSLMIVPHIASKPAICEPSQTHIDDGVVESQAPPISLLSPVDHLPIEDRPQERPSWAHLGPSWGLLGPSWGILGLLGAILESICYG